MSFVIMLGWAANSMALAQPLASGTIYYSRYQFPQGQPMAELWAISPDGSADQRIAVNLPEPGFPVPSKQGLHLALTSLDPAAQNQIRRDVFLFHIQSGALSKITGLRPGNIFPVPNFPASFPFHKAFSPDGSRLAILFYNFASATVPPYDSDDDGDADTLPFSSSSVIPVLYVFGADGSAKDLIHIGEFNEGLYHGGNGVDWSPQQDLLAFPIKIAVPFANSPVNGFVTALFAIEPVQDAMNVGRARRLTSPAGRISSIFEPPSVTWQNDFQPAFSPNGQQVAYVRLQSIISGALRQLSTPSLRIVNTDGSNDREVIRLKVGDYVTHLSWSPDGNLLVFDLGKQAVIQGIPADLPVTETLELYLVKTDGTGLRKLHNAPAAFPTWSPVGQPANLIPIVRRTTPQAVIAGSAGFTLTVSGSNFAPAAAVYWNEMPLPTTFISETQLDAVVPREKVALPGTVIVAVVEPNSGVRSRTSVTFTIERAARLTIRATVAANQTVRVMTLFWPITGDFFLEETESLSASWREVQVAPITSGNEKLVPIVIGSGQRFYRLSLR